MQNVSKKDRKIMKELDAGGAAVGLMETLESLDNQDEMEIWKAAHETV